LDEKWLVKPFQAFDWGRLYIEMMSSVTLTTPSTCHVNMDTFIVSTAENPAFLSPHMERTDRNRYKCILTLFDFQTTTTTTKSLRDSPSKKKNTCIKIVERSNEEFALR